MRKVTLKQMDRTGDTPLEFDLDDPAARVLAQEAIDKARKGGALIVGDGAVVRSVEDLATDNVIIPAIVSG